MYIAAALLILAFLVPNHYLPWMSFYSEFLAFVALLVLGGVLVRLPLKVGASVLFLLLLSCVPLMQFVFGVVFFAGDAWLAAFYLWACCAALVFGRKLYELYAGEVYVALSWIFLTSATVSLWLALSQWFGLPEGLWGLSIEPGGRVTGNLAQSNHLATLFSLGVASVLCLREHRVLGNLSSSLLAVVLIVGLVLTQSRTPWLGAACLLVWWLLKTQNGLFLTRPATIAGWVAFYALATYCLPGVREILMLEGGSGLEQRMLATERLPLWGQAVNAIVNGPVWGYGWNQAGVAQVAAALDYPVELFSLHTHNVVLDFLVWNGPLLGGVGVLLAAVWLICLGWRIVSLGAVFAFLCVGLIILHGLLEYPLEYSYFLLPLCLLVGAVEEEMACSYYFVAPRFSSYLFVFVFGLLLLYSWHEYRILEEDSRLLRFELAGVGEIRAEQEAPDVTLFTQLRELARLNRTEIGPGMSQEKLDWMGRVAYRYPYVPCLYRYATALALNGNVDKAVDVLLRLRSIFGAELFEQVTGRLKDRAVNDPVLDVLIKKLERVEWGHYEGVVKPV